MTNYSPLDLDSLIAALKASAPEYERVLLHLQKHHQLKITGATPLHGGRTLAEVYQVSVTTLQGKSASYVLKLDTLIRWTDDWRPEAQRLKEARSSAPNTFAEQHLPDLPYEPVELDNKSATLYTIANQSIQRCRPANGYSKKPHLEQIFSHIGDGLLNEWNGMNTARSERMHPQEILNQWLDYRLDPTQGSIYDFLEGNCRVPPDTPGLLLEGKTYPNPFYFATNRKAWRGAQEIDVLKGFVHGDLHSGNILAEFSQSLEKLEKYYLIDFSTFTQDQCLFFDHAYLELSYLLHRGQKLPLDMWIDCIQELADSDQEVDNRRVPEALVTACDVINKMRLAVGTWIHEHPISRDDLWGLYRLAAVAAGLNFCNKRQLLPEQRYAALIYAAIYLRSYFILFDVQDPQTVIGINFWQDAGYYKPGNYWEAFREACYGFDQDRVYILIAGPDLHDIASSLKPFGRVDWTIVLDMDQNPEADGLYKAIRDQLAERRKLNLVTFDSTVSINPSHTLYWYAACGLQDRQSTLPSDDSWLTWRQKYVRPLRQFMTDMASNAAEQPVTCVILWNNKPFIRTLCEILLDAFSLHIEFIFANRDSALEEVCQQVSGQTFPISALEIAGGLSRLLKDTEVGTRQIYMPSIKWQQVEIDPEMFNYLEEEMTLLHLHRGLSEWNGRSESSSFLRGEKISWFELGLHQDVDRTKTAKLLKRVQEDLAHRYSTRINLNHQPGAGGTTVARRIAWELHKIYPTVLLHRVTESTIERLRRIRRKTDSPLLVVAEISAEVQPNLLDRLYSQVRAEQFPTVFLRVSRTFDTDKEDERVIYLSEQLDTQEAYAFAQVYARDIPGKWDELEALAINPEKIAMRVPFFFGLTAFEDEFTQIDGYVRARLDGMSEKERKVMCYLALAYHYGHQLLVPQVMAPVLQVDGRKGVWLPQHLDRRRVSLLVQEKDSHGVSWRPRHYLIAGEILKQTLAPADESGKLWRQRLSDWSVHLIEDLAALKGPDDRQVSTYVLDLLENLFVFRDNHDMAETSLSRKMFARSIEDIPEHEGRLRVFNKLTEHFGDENPHFWSHKSRYLGSRKMFPEALEAISQALRLEGNNRVHHHIHGMVLRFMAQDIMTDVERQINKTGEKNQVNLVRIESLVEQAEQAFTKSRELDPTDEHSFVSHVQTITQAIEFQFKISGQKNYSDFLIYSLPQKYAEKLDLASMLIDEVSRLSASELQVESKYIKGAATELHKAFGDYSRVINGWQELLNRSDVYHPSVRRRLVYAYLNRAQDRSWDNLDQEEISLILRLMQDNLDAEPSNDSNVRLWFQAARRSESVDLQQAIEYLQYWYSRSNSIEPLYYIYILQVIGVIGGSASLLQPALKFIDECRRRARHLPNRTSSHNWVGKGEGISRLIHYQRLGRWDEGQNFWSNTNLLYRVPGRIARIERAEAGWIELDCALEAFFVPVRRRGSIGMDFYKDQDENKRVTCYIGLSYDGLRAWSVSTEA